MTSSMSQISYEEGFPNAEYNALNEEEKARMRRDEKERKLKEFQRSTKEKAAKKLREEKEAKLKEKLDKDIKDKERLLKAKDYARKQRELN